jgi:IS605 OrfB family transposase
LRGCARRQRDRTLDHVRQKVVPVIVEAAGGRNIIFEDLSAKEQMVVKGPSKDLRRKLSRWAVGLIQQETGRKSPAVVARGNARGTSSECPRCGGGVSHPSWRVSRCGTCGHFDRDRGGEWHHSRARSESRWRPPVGRDSPSLSGGASESDASRPHPSRAETGRRERRAWRCPGSWKRGVACRDGSGTALRQKSPWVPRSPFPERKVPGQVSSGPPLAGERGDPGPRGRSGPDPPTAALARRGEVMGPRRAPRPCRTRGLPRRRVPGRH